jgi:uncharacterized protein YqjF (DUF2071 family)
MASAVEPLCSTPPFRVERAVMRQTWSELTFLHWPYDPAVVRPLVPRELDLDLFDGAAWIGLVPFLITDLVPPRWPALPWISWFPETNVRTYVVDGAGRRGVWFFSLDAARLAAVIGARIGYGLPYFWAKMRVGADSQRVFYRSRRRFLRVHSDIAIEKGDLIREQSEREVFLTARFRLYARWLGRIVCARVEHPEWPLHTARVVRLESSLVRAAGLPQPLGSPLAHFAPRVDVRAGLPGPVG